MRAPDRRSRSSWTVGSSRLIDRTRAVLGIEQLKTILGWKHRPHRDAKYAPRLERIVNTADHDLTVFKVHFGKLTLKMYDKGARVLRIEAIAHNAKALRRGNSLPRFPLLAQELQRAAPGTAPSGRRCR